MIETIYKILIVLMAILVSYQMLVLYNCVKVTVTNSFQNPDSTFTISFFYKGKAYGLISDVNFNVDQRIMVNKSLLDDSFYIQTKHVKLALFVLFVALLLGILFLYFKLNKDAITKMLSNDDESSIEEY
jgi:hypothetical protein